MNVEIGTEAAQFPEKKYINGIFLAVHKYIGVTMSYLALLGNVSKLALFKINIDLYFATFLAWRLRKK